MRFVGLLLLGGIGLMIMGAYDCFLQFGASSTPTRVTVADIERTVPSNRHLILTAGKPVMDDAVVYWRKKRGVKISETYFIPVQDAALIGYRSFTPPVLLRMSKDQLEAVRQGRARFDPNEIRGVRLTHWDLEGKAEEVVAKRFGAAAVKKMIVLDYQKEVTGIGGGLGQMFFGVLCIVGAFGISFFSGRRANSG